jgi:predicted pyridoxine 5'-phosphate oxidase superfamily flavin-nucleotide-binding protein
MIVPGKDETLRINGPVALTIDPDVLGGFSDELRTPEMAVVIETAEIYGHCAKAFRRASMWEPESWGELEDAPDLAGMYLGTASTGGDEVRNSLGAAYATGLALDRPS